MNKSLSETHPTLWKSIDGYYDSYRYGQPISDDLIQDIQSCTVDVAEHDRICKEITAQEYSMGQTEGYKEGFSDGIAVGERRAMERVKEAIKRAKSRVADTSEGRAYYLAIVDIETDACLGEEEIIIRDGCNEHYHCTGENCKKSTDNNNYTNTKGEE